MKIITLAGLILAATTFGVTTTSVTSPALAADPVCVPGFATIQKTGWLLTCRKTAPISQKNVVLTQAGNANCKTNSYWNFGPKVTSHAFHVLVRVTYTCGHVEG